MTLARPGVPPDAPTATACRHKADQRVAGMRDAGVGQHPFDVGLHDGDDIAEHQGNNGDEQKQERPICLEPAEPFDEDTHECGKAGSFCGDRHEGRDGGRGALIDVGRPHMERHRRELKAEADCHQNRGDQHEGIIRPASPDGACNRCQLGAAGQAVEQRDTIQQNP